MICAFTNEEHRMKEKKLIGVFASGIFSRVQSNLYNAIMDQAKVMGYNLVFFAGTYGKKEITKTTRVTYVLNGLAENMDFEALIIHAQSVGNMDMIGEIIDMGKRKDIPVFVYESNEFEIEPDENVYLLNYDSKRGFAEGVKHIIEFHKCRRIFMLSGMKGNVYSDEREDSYRQEMASHGIEVEEDFVKYGCFWERPAKEAVLEWLDSGIQLPEAICCANDTMAITAAKTLEERGIRVPEDVLVIGFDGIEDAKYNLPSISTCEPVLDAAVKFIFDVLSGESKDNEYNVPLKFIPKESCGCHCDDGLEGRAEIVRLIEGIRHDSWQNHMLTRMYVGLTDSIDMNYGLQYMQGVLDMFEGYSHLHCIRDDIETTTEYEKTFDRMRVQLNHNFLPEKYSGTFSRKEIMPYADEVISNLALDEIMICRLIHNEDKMYGYSLVKVNKFVSNEIRLLDEFIDGATNVIENIIRNLRLKIANDELSIMYDRMSEMYIRDTLTGLYNRLGFNQLFDEYVAREDVKNDFIHLLSIDMDGMKQINDGYGHAEGDNAIRAVARTLKDCFEEPVICARYGGDEFAVAFFADTKSEPSERKISEMLNNYLKKLPMVADKEYEMGVSVGQAVIRVVDYEDFDSLSRIADNNMYVNKRKRKGL